MVTFRFDKTFPIEILFQADVRKWQVFHAFCFYNIFSIVFLYLRLIVNIPEEI